MKKPKKPKKPKKLEAAPSRTEPRTSYIYRKQDTNEIVLLDNVLDFTVAFYKEKTGNKVTLGEPTSWGNYDNITIVDSNGVEVDEFIEDIQDFFSEFYKEINMPLCMQAMLDIARSVRVSEDVVFDQEVDVAGYRNGMSCTYNVNIPEEVFAEQTKKWENRFKLYEAKLKEYEAEMLKYAEYHKEQKIAKLTKQLEELKT